MRKGVAFRDAHAVVGGAVRRALALGKDLAELELEELRGFSDVIEPDVYEVLALDGAVAARDHLGGTAPRQVRAAIERARHRLETGAPRRD